jgi:hypothetical protein
MHQNVHEAESRREQRFALKLNSEVGSHNLLTNSTTLKAVSTSTVFKIIQKYQKFNKFNPILAIVCVHHGTRKVQVYPIKSLLSST